MLFTLYIICTRIEVFLRNGAMYWWFSIVFYNDMCI